MTAKTRYFLFGSVLVLIVGLSIGLVAYYGGMPSGLFSSEPGPAELKYVPGDAAVVAYANVRDVMNSELRQRLRKFEGATDEGRNEFKTQTGIDIERDIDHVVACAGMKAADGSHNGLVVATGRFDSTRLEALAVEHGGAAQDYKGTRIVVVKADGAHGPQGHGGEVAMAFLEPGRGGARQRRHGAPRRRPRARRQQRPRQRRDDEARRGPGQPEHVGGRPLRRACRPTRRCRPRSPSGCRRSPGSRRAAG